MRTILLMALILPGSQALAGGISGNGGGLWACLSPVKEIQTAILVDFHEARDQFGRQLVSTTRTDPFEAAADIEKSLKAKFPSQLVDYWSSLLADVKSRIRYVESEIVVVYDVLNIVKPNPALCATGWEYLQFANYTDYNEVLIRKDYWNSPRVSVLDKAGLLWHEVIYRWMRESYHDQNSVRARRIVGVLFSSLGADEAQKALVEILKISSGDPDVARPKEPAAPAFKPVVICLMRNTLNFRYFFDYGGNKLQAKNNALKTCQDAGDGFHCREAEVSCGAITQAEEKFTCAARNGLNREVFTATGRSKLEAEAKARKTCGDAPDGFHCSSQLECE